MKKIVLSLIAVLLLFTTQAQNNDALIFEAMQTELDRNKKGLKMPNMPDPFFINYIVSEGETITIVASLGGILSSQYNPVVRSFFGRVMTESNELTNDARYTNQGTVQNSLAVDNNLAQLRRGIWMASDVDYKRGLEMLTIKKNALRRINLAKEEEALLDYEKASPVEMLKPSVYAQKIDQKALETLCETLSAQFKKYPKLYASKVQLIACQSTFYNLTSEGTKTKQPLSQVTIRAIAKIRSDDGVVLTDDLQICVADLSKLPAIEELTATVDTFASELQALGSADPVNEYYSGPVLFENGTVVDIFARSLMNRNALYAYRKPIIQDQQPARNIPIGRKLIDTRFSVINHTQMHEYQGKSLVGAYSIDGEGIIPSPDQILVEKGILKSFLNNRVPTLYAPKSNGNNRIGSNPAFITTDVQPSVLEIQATGGLTHQELRQRLIRSAKEEGLAYAYIVRKSTSSISKIYKVDVETGVETLMRSPEIELITTKHLKRVDAVSSEVYVANQLFGNAYDYSARAEAYPVSVICPNALLFQDIEINTGTAALEVKPFVKNPLER